MIKLYKFTDSSKLYWETWEYDGVHTIHWGELGARGTSKQFPAHPSSDATALIQDEIKEKFAEGFEPIELDDHSTLLIEFSINGMGNTEDLDKRHRLEERMDELLGWTGLGNCDGGSMGSGTMDVYCYVVDFDVAKGITEADLMGTEFADYTRIYCADE